jgi:hypothetical protein
VLRFQNKFPSSTLQDFLEPRRHVVGAFRYDFLFPTAQTTIYVLRLRFIAVQRSDDQENPGHYSFPVAGVDLKDKPMLPMDVFFGGRAALAAKNAPASSDLPFDDGGYSAGAGLNLGTSIPNNRALKQRRVVITDDASRQHAGLSFDFRGPFFVSLLHV